MSRQKNASRFRNEAAAARPLAHHLAGDVDVAAPRVSGLGRHVARRGL
jgi:hypothetical protein